MGILKKLSKEEILIYSCPYCKEPREKEPKWEVLGRYT